MQHDCSVKKSPPIVNLPIRLEGNLKCISGNLLSLLGAENKYNCHYFADITNWGEITSVTHATLPEKVVVMTFQVICFRLPSP